MKFFLVRHGETEWNKLGRFQGHYDISLNERGVSQAKETAQAAAEWVEQGAQFFEVGSELDFMRTGASELIRQHREAFGT